MKLDFIVEVLFWDGKDFCSRDSKRTSKTKNKISFFFSTFQLLSFKETFISQYLETRNTF